MDRARQGRLDLLIVRPDPEGLQKICPDNENQQINAGDLYHRHSYGTLGSWVSSDGRFPADHH